MLKLWPISPKRAELILLKTAAVTAVRPDMSEASCCLCSHSVVVHPVGRKIIRKRGRDKVTLICLDCAVPQPDTQPAVYEMEMAK